LVNDTDAGIDWARDELGCPASGWQVSQQFGGYWAASPSHTADGLIITGRDAQELVERVRVQVRVLAIAMDRQGRLPPGGVLCGIEFMAPSPPRLITDPPAAPRAAPPVRPVPTVTPANGHPAQDAVSARTYGYTGDACPECQQMTMVRNGTGCLKCMSCGATTGCS
jgi:hypothetical protein